MAEQRNGGQGSAPLSNTPIDSWRVLVPGNPDSLPRIREMTVEAAEHSGFDAEEVAKIEMAVGEACSNIIEHAYRMQPDPAEIEVQAHKFPNRLEITILDYSPINFPVDEAPGLELEDYLATQARRGLGLYIIRSFVDDVQHRFIDDRGNELRLIKYFA